MYESLFHKCSVAFLPSLLPLLTGGRDYILGAEEDLQRALEPIGVVASLRFVSDHLRGVDYYRMLAFVQADYSAVGIANSLFERFKFSAIEAAHHCEGPCSFPSRTYFDRQVRVFLQMQPPCEKKVQGGFIALPERPHIYTMDDVQACLQA